MAGFNAEQFKSDELAVREELKKYNLHKDPQFMKAFNGYMTQLGKNGQWIQQGATPNANWSGTAATDLIKEFDRLKAFHVPAGWWRANRRNKNFDQQREAKAEETYAKKYLWSKTEPFYPARKAAENGGLILETSPPGKMFNGKNFGFESWSDAPVQADLWKDMSGHYVDGARDRVEAMMLEGRVANSVLTQHEWPHLKELIETGQVTNLHVKVMGIRNASQDSSTWSLHTQATFNVTSQRSFDQIPSPGDPDFGDRQNRWRKQEKARNPSKSSTSSSSSQDSKSSMYSLDTFHKAFDDPNAVVMLSDPAAASTPVAESPQELSRVVTRQLTRANTTLSLQGADRETTKAAVLQALAEQDAAVQSLNGKLTALRSEQERRASASAWPGTHNYDAGLAQGMSSMAPFTTSTADYSPRANVPGTGGSYFPEGVRYSATPLTAQPYTYSLTQTESPAQTSSYAYPPAPAPGAQNFNPAYTNTQERTPSTGSASSDFGAPLQPTQRHPSPPSDGPAPVTAPSSSSKSKSGGKKAKNEPSGLMSWVTGAQYKKKGGPSKG
ncbi:hypothetical protein [Streptomyces sp. NPDC048643]|uniref:hypothetical protein n=1 Tax=Streptomyces sp. NPDC048643 TaxID=3155637 RepID=UPI00341FA4D7